MGYAIFFDKDNVTYRMPVNPEEIKVENKLSFETFEVLKLGQVAIPSFEELKKYSFEVEIPSQPYFYSETPNQFLGCEEYEKVFESWMKSKEPIRFIASNGITSDINTLVLMSYDTVEKSGEEGDKYFSIELTEYKEFSSKIIVKDTEKKDTNKNKAQTKSEKKERKNPNKPKEYIVKKGDSLWYIAKKMYGDGRKYTVIANANKKIIKNPNLIYPGQRLVIP